MSTPPPSHLLGPPDRNPPFRAPGPHPPTGTPPIAGQGTGRYEVIGSLPQLHHPQGFDTPQAALAAAQQLLASEVGSWKPEDPGTRAIGVTIRLRGGAAMPGGGAQGKG